MKSKWFGGAFLLVGMIAITAFILNVWRIFSDNAPLAETLIPALKYWAFSELATGLGIVFLFQAPQRDWNWGEFLSLEWWHAEWLVRGFRILLVMSVVFTIFAILLDFTYKLALAANLF